MGDQLNRKYQRWLDAEADGRDDEADAALAAVFQSVGRDQPVSAGFTARTMEAVAVAAVRDGRRARLVRRLLVPASAVGVLVALYFGAGVIASGLSAAVVWLLNLLIGGVVAAATAAQSDPDGWSLMRSLGRASAAVIANPAVTITIFAVQGFAIAALVLLQRLLGSDRESFR
jgi:hypothetical protein